MDSNWKKLFEWSFSAWDKFLWGFSFQLIFFSWFYQNLKKDSRSIFAVLSFRNFDSNIYLVSQPDTLAISFGLRFPETSHLGLLDFGSYFLENPFCFLDSQTPECPSQPGPDTARPPSLGILYSLLLLVLFQKLLSWMGKRSLPFIISWANIALYIPASMAELPIIPPNPCIMPCCPWLAPE